MFPKPLLLTILSLLDKIESFKNTFFCGAFSCWYDKKLAVALKFQGNQKYELKFRNNTARRKKDEINSPCEIWSNTIKKEWVQ